VPHVDWRHLEDEGDHCRAGCNLCVAPHSGRRVPPPVGKLRWWVCAGETYLEEPANLKK
jgi:hypothetical protein